MGRKSWALAGLLMAIIVTYLAPSTILEKGTAPIPAKLSPEDVLTGVEELSEAGATWETNWSTGNETSFIKGTAIIEDDIRGILTTIRPDGTLGGETLVLWKNGTLETVGVVMFENLTIPKCRNGSMNESRAKSLVLPLVEIFAAFDLGFGNHSNSVESECSENTCTVRVLRLSDNERIEGRAVFIGSRPSVIRVSISYDNTTRNTVVRFTYPGDETYEAVKRAIETKQRELRRFCPPGETEDKGR
ncbi:hypothetical protein [Thermococcus sp. 21S7]|uniref:hypothetical protein n=1 Tax=Thermococcus sp. 21S7 TaxID=1638221 RepID=UPI001438C073|nr:hypothetical protein [Thermococcus sp. 21S7]NJE62079.1 hypothetical protein [Thermococcus sp. 21S7]